MSSSIKNLYQFRTTSKITQAQAAASTFTVGNDIFTNTAVSLTAWSIQLTNRTGSIVELFTVTVSAWVATIATRWIKPDWTTDAIYQYERPKNTLCTLTVLENQIFDKWGSETLTWNITYTGNIVYTKSAKFPVYADATARDAWIPSPANGMMIYNTALWLNQQYIWWARADVDTWAAVSNATTTSTGVWELWELAEVAAWTATWGAWPLIVTPDVLAKQIQSWSYISLASATDSWTDTYVTTATPTLTAYTTGALFVVTFAETNTTTTPTLNIDGLWAVTITDKDSVALAVWDITTNKLILMKEWSAFKIMGEVNSRIEKPLTKLAWENITAWNALRMANARAWDTISQTSASTTQINIGYTAWAFAVWQGFTTVNWWLLTNIRVQLQKIWTPPVWNISVWVYSDKWTTLVANTTTTLASTSVSWSATNYDFAFNSIQLKPATVYYIRVWTTWSVDSSNYIWVLARTNTYSWWIAEQISNANAWSDPWSSHDIYFSLTIWATTETSWRVYKTSASFDYNSYIVWFARNTATTWNSIYIDQQYNTSQSWLTINTTYYLWNSSWAIGTSAWTISRVVWRSISTTELLINLFW